MDPRINGTLCTGTVRKPCLPGDCRSVYLFLNFTIVSRLFRYCEANLESIPFAAILLGPSRRKKVIEGEEVPKCEMPIRRICEA